MLMKRLIIARLVTTLLFTYAVVDLSAHSNGTYASYQSSSGEMISLIIP